MSDETAKAAEPQAATETAQPARRQAPCSRCRGAQLLCVWCDQWSPSPCAAHERAPSISCGLCGGTGVEPVGLRRGDQGVSWFVKEIDGQVILVISAEQWTPNREPKAKAWIALGAEAVTAIVTVLESKLTERPDAKLLRELVAILGDHVGEAGADEGAVGVLRRIVTDHELCTDKPCAARTRAAQAAASAAVASDAVTDPVPALRSVPAEPIRLRPPAATGCGAPIEALPGDHHCGEPYAGGTLTCPACMLQPGPDVIAAP